MGEILIDEPDLIIDDPAGDCVEYWTTLVKEDKINDNILQTENTVQVNLFEKDTGHKKLPKEKKNDLRKKIKKNLANATFPPEQIKKAIEGYAQNPSLMEMRIDQVDPSNIFLFDVCSENFLSVFEYERKGMLQPIEDVEFNWNTFQDCKELNFLNKHQDDFEQGEIDYDEIPKRKSCRIERYESPERPKGRAREERNNNLRDSAKLKYQDRRQDEQTKENDRDQERERRGSSPEKKRLVKLKDSGKEKDSFREREKRDDAKEKPQPREKEKRRRSPSAENRDRKMRSDKSNTKEQSREKERDRSRERSQEQRRRDDYGDRRFGTNSSGTRNEKYDERSFKAKRPYDDHRAQKERSSYAHKDRMDKNDEKDYRDKNYKNYRDDDRTKKVTVIDGDEDHHEVRNSAKYGGYSNQRDRRNNFQQQDLFNSEQFKAKANEMGQFFMQMMTQMMMNQFSSNPNMTNMMEQFMNGRGGFPNNRYQNQRPYNNRYSSNYSNNRGGFQRKPFYSRNDERDRKRRSNSKDRNRVKENQRSRDDSDDDNGKAARRRNY